MFYLILATCCSALIALLMRMSGNYSKNGNALYMANYAVCTALAVIFGTSAFSAGKTGLGFAVGLGSFSGLMYLINLALLRFNIQKNGVVMSSTFMKLGVLVPTTMAVVLYGEVPGLFKVLGFVIAIAAILLINSGTAESSGARSYKLWLIVLLLVGGFTNSLANVYDKNGVAALKDIYLICTFGAALIIAAAMTVVKRQPIAAADLFWGALIGVPNYFCSRFLLKALASGIDAIVIYPAYNIGGILIVTVVGAIVFREKLDRRKIIAIAMILTALLLLNL